MTPRETLEREATVILHGMCRDRHGAAKAISDNLSNYAIGRWVSVDEMLPDDFGSYMTDLGCAYFDPISKDFSHPYVTKWMDLDLPSGKGEA